MAQSAVNDAQRSGVRRAEKQGRRRKRKAAERTAAGAVAVAAVATLGFGQTVGAGQAEALSSGDVAAVQAVVTSPSTALGSLIGKVVNDPALQTTLDQWRIKACATGGTSGGADCSKSTGTGIAIVVPTSVDLVPRVLYVPIQGALDNDILQYVLHLAGVSASIPDAPEAIGSARVVGSGFQFAYASGGGEATAISYLPVSLATAGASDGRKAYAFAVVGMANAWTTSDVPITVLGQGTGLKIPGIKSVSCYGGVTAAYAEGVGACTNILGTFDVRLDQQQSIPEFQSALTDPTAVLFDPASVFGQVVTQLLNGQPLTLSKDFTRLTVGGDRTDAYGLPVLFTLTSDYGTQAPIVAHWLGSSITFNPLVNVNGKAKPNHLGLPVITLGDVDTAQLLPTVDIPAIAFPFGLPSVGPFGETGSAARSAGQITALRATSGDAVVPTRAAAASAVDNSTTPASENNTAAQETDDVSVSVPSADSQTAPAQADSHDEDASRPQAQREASSDPAPQAGADSPNTTPVDGGASAYVGKHRSPDDYVGKHRSTDTGGQVGASSQDGTGSQERAGSHSGAESHTGAAGQAGAVSHAETNSSASSANAE